MTHWALVIYQLGRPAVIQVYPNYWQASRVAARYAPKSYSILPVEQVRPAESELEKETE